MKTVLNVAANVCCNRLAVFFKKPSPRFSIHIACWEMETLNLCNSHCCNCVTDADILFCSNGRSFAKAFISKVNKSNKTVISNAIIKRQMNIATCFEIFRFSSDLQTGYKTTAVNKPYESGIKSVFPKKSASTTKKTICNRRKKDNFCIGIITAFRIFKANNYLCLKKR